MPDNYTIKEILESNFRSLEARIIELKAALELSLKDQDVRVDRQFARLDKEILDLKQAVKELEEANARYKVVWGIGATIGAALIAFFLNRFF